MSRGSNRKQRFLKCHPINVPVDAFFHVGMLIILCTGAGFVKKFLRKDFSLFGKIFILNRSPAFGWFFLREDEFHDIKASQNKKGDSLHS